MTLRLEQFTFCVVHARAVDNLCIGNVCYVFTTKKYPMNVLLDSWNVLNQRTFLDKSSYLMYLASYLWHFASYKRKKPAIYDTLPVINAKSRVFVTNTRVIVTRKLKSMFSNPWREFLKFGLKFLKFFYFSRFNFKSYEKSKFRPFDAYIYVSTSRLINIGKH